MRGKPKSKHTEQVDPYLSELLQSMENEDLSYSGIANSTRSAGENHSRPSLFDSSPLQTHGHHALSPTGPQTRSQSLHSKRSSNNIRAIAADDAGVEQEASALLAALELETLQRRLEQSQLQLQEERAQRMRLEQRLAQLEGTLGARLDTLEARAEEAEHRAGLLQERLDVATVQLEGARAELKREKGMRVEAEKLAGKLQKMLEMERDKVGKAQAAAAAKNGTSTTAVTAAAASHMQSQPTPLAKANRFIQGAARALGLAAAGKEMMSRSQFGSSLIMPGSPTSPPTGPQAQFTFNSNPTSSVHVHEDPQHQLQRLSLNYNRFADQNNHNLATAAAAGNGGRRGNLPPMGPGGCPIPMMVPGSIPASLSNSTLPLLGSDHGHRDPKFQSLGQAAQAQALQGGRGGPPTGDASPSSTLPPRLKHLQPGRLLPTLPVTAAAGPGPGSSSHRSTPPGGASNHGAKGASHHSLHSIISNLPTPSSSAMSYATPQSSIAGSLPDVALDDLRLSPSDRNPFLQMASIESASEGEGGPGEAGGEQCQDMNVRVRKQQARDQAEGPGEREWNPFM